MDDGRDKFVPHVSIYVPMAGSSSTNLVSSRSRFSLPAHYVLPKLETRIHHERAPSLILTQVFPSAGRRLLADAGLMAGHSGRVPVVMDLLLAARINLRLSSTRNFTSA